MSSDNSPEPKPTPPTTKLEAALAWLKWGHGTLAWLIAAVSFVAFMLGRGPAVAPPGPLPPLPPLDYVPGQGWLGDAELIKQHQAATKPIEFSSTPAGQAVRGDEDVFLWRAVRKAAGKPDSWYPNVDQGPVGWCVGAGYKHAADVCLAVQVTQSGGTWKPVSGEVIYAGSRVEVGGGQLSGDGSLGGWAAEWCKRWGLVAAEKHSSVDLTTPDPARARAWGRSGVPDVLEPVAKESPVRTVALVKSWNDVKRAVSSGYPVAVCSMQGFTMTRDGDGFARPQGQWAHCMAILGVRGGPRPGAFILNSWGDRAHTGPRWPEDAPVAGFWADAAVVDRMMAQNDSYALSDAAGFPSRNIDWFVQIQPPVPAGVFVLGPQPQPRKDLFNVRQSTLPVRLALARRNSF